MLVDVPVGASPAGGACSVATVVMLDNGKGDRPAESSGVRVSVGWGKAQSDPPGSRANRQAVADSESVKPRNHFPSEARKWEYRVTYVMTKASAVGEELSKSSRWTHEGQTQTYVLHSACLVLA